VSDGRAPTSVLSAAAHAEIRRLAGLYEHGQSALLPALFVAQGEIGWLSPDAVREVAETLDLALSEVISVASFYHLLHLEPVGRHLIQVCTNLSCMLNGCGKVLQRFQERLGVAPGETTTDRRFTLKTAECLAACEEAPVLLIDEDRHARIDPGTVDDLLKRYS
jgi:NADH-quinone oxidoreductase subunit E